MNDGVLMGDGIEPLDRPAGHVAVRDAVQKAESGHLKKRSPRVLKTDRLVVFQLRV